MDRSIGAQLKQIRESQGIALETIAHKTHISLVYLQAIETDDLEALPSQVHLRGFLRLYAHELGVTLDDLRVGSYHLSDEADPGSPPENEKSAEALPAESPGSQPTESSEGLQELTTHESAPEQKPEIDATSQASIETEPISAEPRAKDSGEIFTAIGEQIKNRRERLGLPIEKIHDILHIRSQHLESIEAGRFDLLPSPVQAKGMLVNYAEFLNLDTNALISDYTDALQLQRIEKQAIQPNQGRRAAREISPARLRLKNFFTLDLLVITTLFIAFASFVIWGTNRILTSDSPQVADNAIPGVSDVLLATETPTPMLPLDAETTPIIEDEVEENETEEEEPLFPPAVSTDPINIILVPRQRLWAQVTVDDEVVFQGRLLPGNAYDFSGQEQIDVLTGNIGALQILFNNQEIPSQGLIGQVADLSFTENGLVLPAPTNTPTITETPEVTPTSTPTQPDDEAD